MDIHFISSDNACRTIMAEAILRKMAPDGVSVHSAGCTPKGTVHPMALFTLGKAGFSTGGLKSKHCDAVPGKPDLVIALCDTDLIPDSVYDEDDDPDSPADPDAVYPELDFECPMWIGRLGAHHWGLYDPSRAEGSRQDLESAFQKTFDELQERIGAFVATFPWQWHLTQQ